VTATDHTWTSSADDLPAPDRSVVPPAEVSRAVRLLAATGVVGACAAAMTFLYQVNPNLPDNPYPRCLLKAVTGIDCPGCGGTRAMYSLLHGDLAGAADHNIIVFAVVPLMLYFLVRYLLMGFGVRLPLPKANRWTGWATLVLVLAFTVVRNLTVTPFGYLGSA
jgi:hypothetical protein